MPEKGLKKFIPVIIISLFLANIYFWLQIYVKNDGKLHLYVFDVGQGDSVFLKTPFNQDILIDGGPNKKVLEGLNKAMPFWDKKIELVILTHPHADHVVGLLSVLDRYKVENIVYSGAEYDSIYYADFLEKARNSGARISIIKKGSNIRFGERTDLKILGPGKNVDNNINNSSIVGLFNYKDFKIMLSGDAEAEEWGDILGTEQDLRAQVLKVAHHGSNNGTSEDILKQISPEVSFISAGEDNKYGHPHEEVLELLQKYKIMIFQTDKDGTKEIISDGMQYFVK